MSHNARDGRGIWPGHGQPKHTSQQRDRLPQGRLIQRPGNRLFAATRQGRRREERIKGDDKRGWRGPQAREERSNRSGGDQQTTSCTAPCRRTKARPRARIPTSAGMIGAGASLSVGAEVAATAATRCASQGPALSKQALGWRAGSAIITVATAGIAAVAAARLKIAATKNRIKPPLVLHCDITGVDDKRMKANRLLAQVSTTCGHVSVTTRQLHKRNHAVSYAAASIRDAAHRGKSIQLTWHGLTQRRRPGGGAAWRR